MSSEPPPARPAGPKGKRDGVGAAACPHRGLGGVSASTASPGAHAVRGGCSAARGARVLFFLDAFSTEGSSAEPLLRRPGARAHRSRVDDDGSCLWAEDRTPGRL